MALKYRKLILVVIMSKRSQIYTMVGSMIVLLHDIYWHWGKRGNMVPNLYCSRLGYAPMVVIMIKVMIHHVLCLMIQMFLVLCQLCNHVFTLSFSFSISFLLAYVE